LHEGDGDDLGVGEGGIVVIRTAPAGKFRVGVQVVIDEHVAFDKAVL